MPPAVRRTAAAPRAARLLAAVTIGLTAACGGDAPTVPVDPGPTQPTPSTLVASSATARPNELITLRPAGLSGAVPDTITGTIGTAPIRAGRLDDTTLVALVPTGLSGTQTVRFTIGGRDFATPITLAAAAPTAADPTGTAAALIDGVVAMLDSLDAEAVASGGDDTTTVRAILAAGRASVEQARADFLALTTDEQAAALPFLVAEAAAQGVTVDGVDAAARIARSTGGASASRLAPSAGIRPLCTLVTSFDLCAGLSTTRSALHGTVATIGRCAIDMSKGAFIGGVFGGVVGGLPGFLAGGAGAIPGVATGMAHGAKIGAGIALGMCMSDAAKSVSAAFTQTVKPVLTEAAAVSASRVAPGSVAPMASRVGTSAAAALDAYVVGVARPVDVHVEFHSLSAADASGPAPVAELVALFNQLATRWEALRAKVTLVSLPSLTLPAAPRTVVRKRVPGSYLSVASAAPAPIAGSSAGADQWTVTFANAGQGDDHDFSYTVRFSYPGFPDQQRTLTGLLQPARYTVASLAIDPAADTIFVDRQATFAWTASDSSGDVLTATQLAGRAPTWTSASETVATVGATTGTVTGKGAGTTTLAAALETGRGTATVRVVPDIAGTYVLQSIGGVAVPGVTYEDTVYVIRTTGGSVQLREDGTFGYSLSATGTNVHTNATYDEGGSGGGTYRVSDDGTAFTFETTAQEGTPVSFGTGFVSGGTLTVVVTTPDGGGTAILVKQ